MNFILYLKNKLNIMATVDTVDKALRRLEKVGEDIEHLTISELKQYKQAVDELNSKLDAALINEPLTQSVKKQLIEWDVDKKI